MQKIILASTSPRRKELLQLLKIPFTIESSNVDELSIRHKIPEKLVAMLAEAKARAVAKIHSDAIVIGSDTIIVLNGKIIEKANNKAEQHKMIYEQLGQTTEVITAVTIIDSITGRSLTGLKKTECKVAKPSDNDIYKYIESGQGMDKGGGFGLQDENGMFIELISGCYTNCIGFPICIVSEMLNDFEVSAIDPRKIVKEIYGKSC